MTDKNSLFRSQIVPLPVGDASCRINIAGYTLENYQKFNPDGYTILCETGKYCDLLSFFPNTHTVVLEGQSQCQLTKFPQRFIPDLAEKMDVSIESAFEQSSNFFADKTILVKPSGIQSKVYRVMLGIQNIAPTTFTYKAVTQAKTTGLTGLKIISAAPLTFVGATYLGGMVCGYFGSVAGDNVLGMVFNTSSYILTRPMKGVEIVLNGLFLKPLSHITGLPLILNATNELMFGEGINAGEYVQIGLAFERVSNSKNIQRLKKTHEVMSEIWGKWWIFGKRRNNISCYIIHSI